MSSHFWSFLVKRMSNIKLQEYSVLFLSTKMLFLHFQHMFNNAFRSYLTDHFLKQILLNGHGQSTNGKLFYALFLKWFRYEWIKIQKQSCLLMVYIVCLIVEISYGFMEYHFLLNGFEKLMITTAVNQLDDEVRTPP